MKFRKKPVVIEAVRVSHSTFDDPHPNPDHVPGVVYDPVLRRADMTTLEGNQATAYLGDWIITGVKGEVYPCNAEVFAATYEPA